MSPSPLSSMYPVSEVLPSSDPGHRGYKLGDHLVIYHRGTQTWWLDGDYGEFVKMSARGEEIRITWDAEHYHSISWEELDDKYRAQALMLICPD